ncbi:hypothetical protein FB45DRAFT_834042 [Roridomyces roridus]|uniref:5-hydroxyisourate hydrolase n=1 Tax=Roridomyces roridus TaxID=1738132 RepID=A0AAD7BUP9_9AGAR|nr:hypothetical protein FB45DRAFT_834042 [Roridomyces roridus]
MSKSPITCHVLDSSTGKPAEGVEIRLQSFTDEFTLLASGVTNSDGRCLDLLSPSVTVAPGIYKIIFATKEYLAKTNRKCFYPWVDITFEIENPGEHYHIPLLISPYSFTTYRGS